MRGKTARRKSRPIHRAVESRVKVGKKLIVVKCNAPGVEKRFSLSRKIQWKIQWKIQIFKAGIPLVGESKNGNVAHISRISSTLLRFRESRVSNFHCVDGIFV